MVDVSRCSPLSSSSFFRSVVKATRFLQDQEQTSGMEGQWVLLGRFSHSHTYANSIMKPQKKKLEAKRTPHLTSTKINNIGD